jgi:hypothetical protein
VSLKVINRQKTKKKNAAYIIINQWETHQEWIVWIHEIDAWWWWWHRGLVVRIAALIGIRLCLN